MKAFSSTKTTKDKIFYAFIFCVFFFYFRQHTMSKLSRAIKFIMAIWLLAFFLAAPQAFQFTVLHYPDGVKLCTVS